MFRIAFSLGWTLLLLGCAAGLEEDYSCSQVGGTPGCVGMDEIRSNLKSYVRSGSSATPHPTPPLVTDFTILPRRNRHGEPSRTEDVVKKVTIFPFIDTRGHYVDTTDIYLILDDSRWTGRPASAIWED
ncbi:type IV conjugative transfer system lipoprotein TraV [Vibrio brasiliensis]|uniref:type IV conjugative transfer system lipoprotein TraV n=1 Tax=Vibrio brasiliensis TaxID=170652 RepID=UPI001EFCA260|nr:type IV conjugative transfer system lipoprotein TraV [Vibrio brasiliensis]MCG9727485.1 type IV conjugative transfer system lipoprotein TraV [Vibrio brasiliensis]